VNRLEALLEILKEVVKTFLELIELLIHLMPVIFDRWKR
jgi:hypothetical protein